MVSDDTDERPEGDDGRLEADGADRAPAAEEVDQRIVDLLSWILDTETSARIYVHLLADPGSTSEEVATGTGLYPSTVREALAELHDEGRVTREKRQSEGAGNNPYEYTAIQPSELVGGVVDQVQRELNAIFTLDRNDAPDGAELEPVTITVDDADAGPEGDDPMMLEDDMDIDAGDRTDDDEATETDR
ncbi:winged helix-turn-helix transcriptional regulator [Natronococcus sp. JC468]|uniref:helix-turn-helix domain-containing protein n=1 Tax=Natronococcus sp. JC468 TaxID=1961921 RepID=UPI00143B0BCF|nr:helix-turn-helix domain-containing protein [Natronococcus sp. JC468]NKE37698.1 winged helix-turn-helix transcriptional regulator [Natronococcus sp. JC468]